MSTCTASSTDPTHNPTQNFLYNTTHITTCGSSDSLDITIHVSIEVFALDKFSAPKQPCPLLVPGNFSRYALFHSFYSDESKHDSATTTAHSKKIVKLLKNRQLLLSVI